MAFVATKGGRLAGKLQLLNYNTVKNNRFRYPLPSPVAERYIHNVRENKHRHKPLGL